jgi:hypothetical protein
VVHATEVFYIEKSNIGALLNCQAKQRLLHENNFRRRLENVGIVALLLLQALENSGCLEDPGTLTLGSS